MLQRLADSFLTLSDFAPPKHQTLDKNIENIFKNDTNWTTPRATTSLLQDFCRLHDATMSC